METLGATLSVPNTLWSQGHLAKHLGVKVPNVEHLLASIRAGMRHDWPIGAPAGKPDMIIIEEDSIRSAMPGDLRCGKLGTAINKAIEAL